MTLSLAVTCNSQVVISEHFFNSKWDRDNLHCNCATNIRQDYCGEFYIQCHVIISMYKCSIAMYHNHLYEWSIAQRLLPVIHIRVMHACNRSRVERHVRSSTNCHFYVTSMPIKSKFTVDLICFRIYNKINKLIKIIQVAGQGRVKVSRVLRHRSSRESRSPRDLASDVASGINYNVQILVLASGYF